MTVTNAESGTNVHEIAEGIFRISTPVPPTTRPGGFTFNQFLLADEQPLLFHTGLRGMFPLVRQAVQHILGDVNRLRYVGFSHVEADESGSLNDWLAVAPRAEPVCSQVAATVQMNDLADRPLDLILAPPVAERSDLDRVRRCMKGLDLRSRTVLYLSFARDKPADEIARVLETTAGNVRVLRHRAVAMLASPTQPSRISATEMRNRSLDRTAGCKASGEYLPRWGGGPDRVGHLSWEREEQLTQKTPRGPTANDAGTVVIPSVAAGAVNKTTGAPPPAGIRTNAAPAAATLGRRLALRPSIATAPAGTPPDRHVRRT